MSCQIIFFNNRLLNVNYFTKCRNNIFITLNYLKINNYANNIDESFIQYYHIEKRPQKMNKNAKGHGDFFIFKKVLWDLIESEEKER